MKKYLLILFFWSLVINEVNAHKINKNHQLINCAIETNRVFQGWTHSFNIGPLQAVLSIVVVNNQYHVTLILYSSGTRIGHLMGTFNKKEKTLKITAYEVDENTLEVTYDSSETEELMLNYNGIDIMIDEINEHYDFRDEE